MNFFESHADSNVLIYVPISHFGRQTEILRLTLPLKEELLIEQLPYGGIYHISWQIKVMDLPIGSHSAVQPDVSLNEFCI